MSGGRRPALLRRGPTWLDTDDCRFGCPAGTVVLRPRETATLAVLLNQAGEVVPRDRIIRDVFGPDPSVGANAVELYIARLRRRLHGMNVHIRTFRGLGYMLDIQQ